MKIRIPWRIKQAVRILCAPTNGPLRRPQPSVSNAAEDTVRESLFQKIKSTPISSAAHRELGDYYTRRGAFVSAIAEYRTALTFAPSASTSHALAKAYRAAGYLDLAEQTIANLTVEQAPDPSLRHHTVRDLEKLQTFSPERYQRLQALADRVRALQTGRVRLLDIGGGEGALCLFLPEIDYVLAEPTTNGLSGIDLGLPNRFFEIVVACHVLEHIIEEHKEAFLNTLCGLATNRVVLLGPVADTGSVPGIDAFFFRITRAAWALEHIDCKLPSLQMLESFANSHGFQYSSRPNGNAAATYWMVFALHYAGQAGKTVEATDVVRYSNKYLNATCSNPNQPNDYFVEIAVAPTGA